MKTIIDRMEANLFLLYVSVTLWLVALTAFAVAVGAK